MKSKKYNIEDSEINSAGLKEKIHKVITSFSTGNLFDNTLKLFSTLGYRTERQSRLLENSYAGFIDDFPVAKSRMNEKKTLYEEWKSIDLVFQLTQEDMSTQSQLFDSTKVDNTIIEAYLFFAIELSGLEYSKTQLSDITRELNKVFPMPVLVVFKYGNLLTLSVIQRRLHNTDQSKDVLEKVTLVKDINIESPHRAHIEILFDLSIDELQRKQHFTNFVELHNAWKKTLDTKELNKRFYLDLFNWYLWAVRSVRFPNNVDDDKNDGVVNSESVIRLLTRLIFVWFIKEKKLVPDSLFDISTLKINLKDFHPQSEETSVYYRAILQNLFFATLNTPMDKDVTPENEGEKRQFVTETHKTFSDQYLDQTKYRYADYFADPGNALELFATIPFLNGGLFECLDFKDGNKEIRFDGFSSKEKNQAFVPEKLFFAEEFTNDFNAEYGTKGKKYKVEGLINLLNRYKFTITENTPLEEEIALDPEMLGKVFENLLASYNPETRTTARKQTGSFYTPREIVNYMVDESLIAYLKQKLGETDETEHRLRFLFSQIEDSQQFTEDETNLLIKAISEAKILDPACGSGAFPMGILHRLVDLLKKLDPNNVKWNQLQIERATAETAEVFKSGNITERVIRFNEINKAFDLSMNYPDYARKLFLIENCIYGVDIQQIAIQISKLRFFISLIVDQKVDDSKPNRNILSMPNLETKFVAANTLIGLDIPQQMTLMAGDVEPLEKELASIRHKIFFTRKYSAKKELKKQEKAKLEELRKALMYSGFGESTATHIAGWNPFDPMQSAGFFDPETMFGLTKSCSSFDNKPVQSQNNSCYFDIVIGNPPYIKEYTFRKAFEGVRNSPYYQGKMDLWYLFACKNLDYLKKKTGILCFIATNNWTTNAGASIMRSKILNETTIHLLLDFGNYMIFESADIQTMVMIFRTDNTKDNYNFEFRRLVGKGIIFDDVIDLITKKQTEKTEYYNPHISKQKLKDKVFTFNNNINKAILDKIKSKGNFLLSENEIANGIHPHHDFVSKAAQKVLGDNFTVGQGIFVLNNSEKEGLNLNSKERELIKPYFTTKQIHKWYGKQDSGEWIIYTDSKFRNVENIMPYPNIKKHLDKFQTVITSDNKPYGLHRAREEYFFLGNKIIVLRKCANEPKFTFTDFDCYVSATFYVIKSDRINLKYLTAILNSKLIAFWLKNMGKMQGCNYQLDKEPLMRIPILTTNDEKSITILVDKILSTKTQDPKADITALETKIDEHVYKLYELTYKEVKEIDPMFWLIKEEYDSLKFEVV